MSSPITEEKLITNLKDDMAICNVTNSIDLPLSILTLLKFKSSTLEEQIMDLKSQRKRLFVACSIGQEYFFSGGNRETSTHDIELNYIGNISLPIPTAKGCSGGALLIIDEDSLITPMFSKIFILGILQGYVAHLEKEGTGNYYIWTL